MTDLSFKPDEIPYFSYDRDLTTASILKRLQEPGSSKWIETAAWIMREATFPDVWFFLTPEDVGRHLNALAPRLGKKQDFWRYIIGAWRELGRLESSDAA